MKLFRMGLLVSVTFLLAAASVWPQAKPFASPQDTQKIYDHLLPQVDRIPEEKALELARMYLHDNAARLYGEMK